MSLSPPKLKPIQLSSVKRIKKELNLEDSKEIKRPEAILKNDLNKKPPEIDSSEEDESEMEDQLADLREDDILMEITEVTKVGYEKASPSQFDLLKVIGQGGFGKVFLVKKNIGKDKGCLYAMKVLEKATFKLHDITKTKLERNILTEVEHPFIVKLHYAFQTEGKLYLILDFMRGGDLFTRLSNEKHRKLKEVDVRFYVAEIVLALEHLHKLGIIYRDLKSENLLLNLLLDADGHISLTDFGLSKQNIEKIRSYTFCGTWDYMAPEIISGRGYSYAVDWWSLGILMYEMLVGRVPFDGKNKQERIYKVTRSKVTYPDSLSVESTSLLKGLMNPNPVDRLGAGKVGAEEIKQHRFFASINWEDLFKKKISPPFKPTISEDATYNFDSVFTSEPVVDEPVSPPDAQAEFFFRGFSYVSPSLMNQFSCEFSEDVQRSSSSYKKFLKLKLPKKFSRIFISHK